MLLAPLWKGKSKSDPSWLWRFLILILAYSITGWLGLSVPFETAKVTLFWLPSGIAVAALYCWSMKMWPAIFIAAFALGFTTDSSFASGVMIACGNTLGPLVTTLLLRRFDCHLLSLHRANTFYFLIISCAGMLIPAAVGSSVIALTHADALQTNYWQIALVWWMGDSLGVFLAAPLLINITRINIEKLQRQKRNFLWVMFVSLAVALLCFPFNNFPSGYQLPIVFISFVCVGWSALSFGLLGSALTTLGFSFMAIWSTAHNLGPFSGQNLQFSYWMIWIYSASMTVLGLLITAAYAEIMLTSTQLTESHLAQEKHKKYLEAVIQAIPDLLFDMDREGNYLSANGTTQISGLLPENLIGKNIADIMATPAQNSWRIALAEADEWGLSQGRTIQLTFDAETHWFELSIAKRTGKHRDDDRFICVARDITKRIHTHQNDLANEQRFRNIFETTRNIAVQGYNRHHEVIFWNKTSEDLYGFSAAEAMGKKLEDLIIPHFMCDTVFEAIEDWHIKNIPIPSGELALKNAKGNEVWVYSNHVLIDTPENKEMYCLDIDLGPQRKAFQRVEQELAERKQVEEALRQSEQRLESAQLMARVAHWTWYTETDTYCFSPSMMELFHLPHTLLEGKFNEFTNIFIHHQDRTQVHAALADIAHTGKPLSMEFRLNIAGYRFWLQAQANPLGDEKQHLIQGTFQDITERKRLDLALVAAAADAASAPDFFVTILKALAEAVSAEHALISLFDTDNPATATTHTYLKQGETQTNFSYPLAATPCANIATENICFIASGARESYPGDTLLTLHKIDSYMGVAIKNAQGMPIGALVILGEKPLSISPQVRSLMLIFAERISGELRRAVDQEKIFNLAFFDPLTHLPNRRMLLDRLKLVIAQSARNDQHGALLFIDLDHFKLLNDTRGHHIGDQLLVQVAERIRGIIRASDVAARLGGDEFVVVFDNLGTDPEVAALEAKHRAEKLHELINLPYPLQQSVYHCTISIGVNLFNSKNRSIDDLLRHADVAMYQAKDSGRNAIRFFDPNMQSRLEKRAAIEADLRIAYESGNQLTPYYQVQVDNQCRAVGAELLLRWYHQTKGMISPADFIPVAEQTGLIVAIGKQVIRQACDQLNRWKTRPEFNHLTIAVNVSPIQFNQPHFVDDVLNIVEASGINPHLLKLELTESSLLKNVDHSIEKMQELQAFGIGFSMDDFGIGYSSLSYLKRLPLDQLKIDQTFVRDIAVDPNDTIIVRTIIAMAQNMNLNVIAEGVETEAQKNFLEQNGCPMFQGYYFGRPLPIAAFETQLLERNYCPT